MKMWLCIYCEILFHEMCLPARKMGVVNFFYIVEYDENEETSCFNLHVITVCGTSYVSRNPSKKRQMSTSPI